MIELHFPNSHIAHLVPRLCKLHHGRVSALLSGMGLYRGQPVLLAVLWEREGLAHSELATQLGVTPATITKMLQRMEQAGFVTRHPDSADQRISRVYLTERGRQVRQQVDKVFRTLEEEMLSGFGDDERDQLLGYLLRVCDNLQRASARGDGSAESVAAEGTN